MKKPRLIIFLLAAFACLSLPGALAAEPASATEGGSLHLVKQQNFPSIHLRGYGTVSGSLLSTGSNSASLLSVHCENSIMARILQAKYLSDLGLLPGVTPLTLQTKRGNITARQINAQGVVAALRSGADVFILAARDSLGIIALEDENLPAVMKIDATDATEAEAHVPMYLDRWERYGMRFYYEPFTTPKARNDFKSAYDPMDDFNFARDEGTCGLVLWHKPLPLESAEGILQTPTWDWILGQARKMGLPVGGNLSMSATGSLYNRYRQEWALNQPQYIGGWYTQLVSDEGIFSWNSITARDAQLAVLQQTIRHYGSIDNIVNWLEPDGEIQHDADYQFDYGPTADAGYRRFLKSRYATVRVVAQRWYGDAAALHAWDDVHVPEVTSFLGWGKDAIDLTGMWKVSHEAAAGPETAAPGYDDSKWPSIPAPGHAIAILLPRKPEAAVFRRHIDIDRVWRKAHDRVWLYVFDMSNTNATNPPTRVFLNGAELAEAAPAQPHAWAHWAAYDVSSSLNSGDNMVAVDIGHGFFNSRVYFSKQEPRSYPGFGPQINARWADFTDWISWARAGAVRRGAQMIRQADPNRPITFMMPGDFAADIKPLSEDYGAVFHDTLAMAGSFTDYYPMTMESSNMPTDLEPGTPAKTLAQLKGYLGRWSVEGIQGIDYFQHMGDVEWKPDLKSFFHETINLWHLIGKYHVPKAQVALLASDRVARLYGFFHPDPEHYSPRGDRGLRFNQLLLPEFPREEIFEPDFDRGNADAYKVIVDLNTSVMDDDYVAKIGKWVKAGGIFITWDQTGRNTTTEKDAWPISTLTGYKVDDTNHSMRTLRIAGGQQILRDNPTWSAVPIQGAMLKKQAPACTDLLQWDDGTTAIGMRPLGKGFVIQVGSNFGNDVALALFQNVFGWAKIEPVPATAPGVTMRHFVSNNSLYDIWAMWNGTQSPVKTTLAFRNGLHPKSALDVKTGQPVMLEDGTSGPAIPVALDTFETQVLLTPRDRIASAPADWFQLQRQWWRGSGDLGPALQPFKSKFTLDLQPGWSFKNLDGPADGSRGKQFAGADFDDSSWEKRPLGIFTFPDHHDAKDAMFRKQFTVPAHWNRGKITLWLAESHGSVSYIEYGQVWLDGEPLSSDAISGDDLTVTLKPGTTHTLAVEIWGTAPVLGIPASIWLNYRPDPFQQQDLTGNWSPAADGLTYTAPVPIPGSYTGITLRQTVKIDSRHAGQTAVLHVSAQDASIYGAIVNGTWISRYRRHMGNDFDLAITPCLKFGDTNEIILFGHNGPHALNAVSLDYYSKGTYP